MQPIRLESTDGSAVQLSDSRIVVTSLFPHMAVVDVTLTLAEKARSALPLGTLIVQGQPSLPSLRLLVNGRATTEFEVLSADVTNAKLILHLPPASTAGTDGSSEESGRCTITLQWHTSFVPMDGGRMVLTLPSVEGVSSSSSSSKYRLAMDWGTCKMGAVIVDRAGRDVVRRHSGGGSYEAAFEHCAGEKGSLALFVTIKEGALVTGGDGPQEEAPLGSSSAIVRSVLKSGAVYAVSAIMALIATIIFRQIYG